MSDTQLRTTDDLLAPLQALIKKWRSRGDRYRDMGHFSDGARDLEQITATLAAQIDHLQHRAKDAESALQLIGISRGDLELCAQVVACHLTTEDMDALLARLLYTLGTTLGALDKASQMRGQK